MISPIMEEYEEIQTNICLCSDGHVLTGCKEITEYTPLVIKHFVLGNPPFMHRFSLSNTISVGFSIAMLLRTTTRCATEVLL